MFRPLRGILAAAAAVAFVSVPAFPQAAEAQAGSRFQVMVPDMQPTDGSSTRFGERVANRVRDMIDLDRYVGVSRRDMERAARDFDLRRQDLDCITARQLASQANMQLVMCGEYEEEGDHYRFRVTFYTVPAGEEFPIPEHLLPAADDRQAAEYIVQSFTELSEQVRTIGWCGDDYNAQNWEGALNYCTQAVEMAPESRQVRLALAMTYRHLEDYEKSLEQFERLLAMDSHDATALENAGWVAGQLGDTDAARDYYTRYLEVNPDNVSVRLRVAYDLAQAGDAFGAMMLLEEGIQQQPDNVDLNEQYGSYAFRAAVMRQAEQPRPQTQDNDAPRLDPEVEELFRTALRSYDVVIEAQGSETRPSYITNSMRAYLQLGEPENAIELGERGLRFFPENADIHSIRADAYNRLGNVDRAISSLERALEVNPDLPNARARMGNFYMQAGRVDRALEALKRAAEAGEQTANQLAGIIFNHGYSEYVQPERNLPEGIRLIVAAKEFDVTPDFRGQLNFFHGYAVFRHAARLQEPQSLESAQRSLPLFQEAKRLFQQGSDWAQQHQRGNYQNLMGALDQFIEIQELIIRRGR